MKRRQFVAAAGGFALNAAFAPRNLFGTPTAPLGFSFADVTTAAGIQFQHNSGAFGGKFLPETWALAAHFWTTTTTAGKTFSGEWHGLARPQAPEIHSAFYHNNRNGSFTDVTHAAGLDIEMYGMGAAIGDYNNDGFPDIFISCVGQNRLFKKLATVSSRCDQSGRFLGGRKVLALQPCGSIRP